MGTLGGHHVVTRRSLLRSATAAPTVAGGAALYVGALAGMPASPTVAAGRVTPKVWIHPPRDARASWRQQRLPSWTPSASRQVTVRPGQVR